MPTGPLIRNHDRDPEHREGLSALGGREGIREDRLRDRHHAAAAEALQNAEQQKRRQIPGKAAEDGTHREQRDAAEIERFAAEPPGHEAAGREDNGVGHEVARDRP
jgi:hypothetical protein